jgi:hypothetical protein
MVILNRNSGELTLNHIYLKVAYVTQFTVIKLVQTKTEPK